MKWEYLDEGSTGVVQFAPYVDVCGNDSHISAAQILAEAIETFVEG